MEATAKMTRLEKMEVAKMFAALPQVVKTAFAAGEAMAEFRLQAQAESKNTDRA